MRRHVYALHRPRGNPLAARLYRFSSPGLRNIRTERDPARWEPMPETRVATAIHRADARRRWRYESPGTWSTPFSILDRLRTWKP